ncbi:hypothetical protein CEXT_802031 [Caerostris extrusa]|uniref:Uncharacterized protein n=1 Tax=Caerostris extrusa TaxID=172846 RepID=A0AAV4P6K2_CAEEX|nr:hypothetical protein CEXT_802031 [Caerostris extrusa]
MEDTPSEKEVLVVPSLLFNHNENTRIMHNLKTGAISAQVENRTEIQEIQNLSEHIRRRKPHHGNEAFDSDRGAIHGLDAIKRLAQKRRSS